MRSRSDFGPPLEKPVRRRLHCRKLARDRRCRRAIATGPRAAGSSSAAGFCGLAVMTMAVTYLLEVQGSVSQRDIGIIKLNTIGRRTAVGADPPPAIRRDRQPRRAARPSPRSTQLVRDGATKPLEPSVPDLFPVGRNGRGLARRARGAARPRASERALHRRSIASRGRNPAPGGRDRHGARAGRHDRPSPQGW